MLLTGPQLQHTGLHIQSSLFVLVFLIQNDPDFAIPVRLIAIILLKAKRMISACRNGNHSVCISIPGYGNGLNAHTRKVELILRLQESLSEPLIAQL